MCLNTKFESISNIKKLLDDYGFLFVFTAVNSDVLNIFLYC